MSQAALLTDLDLLAEIEKRGYKIDAKRMILYASCQHQLEDQLSSLRTQLNILSYRYKQQEQNREFFENLVDDIRIFIDKPNINSNFYVQEIVKIIEACYKRRHEEAIEERKQMLHSRY